MARLLSYKAGHENKISRSHRTIFKSWGCYLVLHGGENETFVCFLLFLLWCSSSSSRPLFQGFIRLACVWVKERGTLALLWAIPSHPSQCALSGNCCLIGSEMLFPGLTIYKERSEGSESTGSTKSTINAQRKLSGLIVILSQRGLACNWRFLDVGVNREAKDTSWSQRRDATHL